MNDNMCAGNLYFVVTLFTFVLIFFRSLNERTVNQFSYSKASCSCHYLPKTGKGRFYKRHRNCPVKKVHKPNA